MPEQENGQQLKLPPEHGVVRIHVDQGQGNGRPDRNFSMRAIWSAVTGVTSGAAAWFAAHVYAQDKMLEYETDYLGKTVETVTGKGGLGAALAEGGAPLISGTTLNNLGPGMVGRVVEDYNMTRLIRDNPEKYGFAKWMRRIGGKGNFAAGVGVATGAAVGLATYAAVGKEHKQDEMSDKMAQKDWQGKIASDKDEPRGLN